MAAEQNPNAWEIDSIGYVAAQMQNLEEILGGIDANRFGPDFKKACEHAYATRRYLEIELTQYGSDDCCGKLRSDDLREGGDAQAD